MWYNSDEGARDLEVLYLQRGLCFINSASMCGKSRHLPRETCGISSRSRKRIETGQRETGAERTAGVSRGRSRKEQVELVRHSKAEEAEQTDRPSRKAKTEGPNH